MSKYIFLRKREYNNIGKLKGRYFSNKDNYSSSMFHDNRPLFNEDLLITPIEYAVMRWKEFVILFS